VSGLKCALFDEGLDFFAYFFSVHVSMVAELLGFVNLGVHFVI
jgi:hypothetical protein